MTARRSISAVLAAFSAAAVTLGLPAATRASTDTCSVAVVDDATGRTLTFPDVPLPSGVPADGSDQPGLMAALVAAGAVAPGSLDLGEVTLEPSCQGDASGSSTTGTATGTGTGAGTGTTSTSTSTTSTTTTSASSSSSTTSTTTGSASAPGALGTIAPTAGPAPPPSTGPAPGATSTAPPGPTTSTSARGTTAPHGTTTRRTTAPPRSTSTTTTSRSAPTRRTLSTSSATVPPSPRAGRSRAERSSSRATATTGQGAGTTARGAASGTTTITIGGGSGGSTPTFNDPFAFPLGGALTYVPNLFIDSFQIPPFLLPIYQAAGVEYDVPWQVLAAINEIETNFGRNLAVSSAGAVGWMQFMPSTWRRWGVDANNDGVADPYNPVDAIFAAARYLHAVGASQNLSQAIFGYNHAGWYVQSVLLRAKLIGGISNGLITALTGLVEGRFPVAARAHYAEDSALAAVDHRVRGANAADAIDSDPSATGVSIFARRGAPVIAVGDGKIVRLGHSATLGDYVVLQDATGNTYTYAHLGSISRRYAAPKPVRITPADIAAELRAVTVRRPTTAASVGTQSTGTAASAGTQSTGTAASAGTQSTGAAPAAHRATRRARSAAPLVKVRLFADPARPASYAAGGRLQMHHGAGTISNFADYFSGVLHLAPDQYTLRRLRVGSIVVGGTILGRIGSGGHGAGPHARFMIQPAGRGAPRIDPGPILDGWKLLAATDVYRSDAIDPLAGPGGRDASIGQILLMSKQQLMRRTLADPGAKVYACGRRDVQAGLIDRRVLGVIEFLSASGLHPTVSGLACDAGSDGIDAAGRTGESVDISAINGAPVDGHLGPASVTALTIRRLLTLQGAMAPDEIVSGISFKGQPTTLALPDHRNRIQVSFTANYGADRRLSAQAQSVLRPGQWTRLIDQISQIPEPVVPVSPSRYAIRERRR